MNTENLIKLIQINHENGKNKDQVCELLMNNGAKFSQIPKLLKESGIKFGRAKGEMSLQMRVAQLVVNNTSITVPEIEEAMKEFTSNHKYVANHFGGYLLQFLELMDNQ